MADAQFHIDFMGWRKVTAVFSITLVLISIVVLSVRWLNLGLDFTGGTLVEVVFEQPQDPERVRGWLVDAGFRNGVVQNFGTPTDLLVRMPPQADQDQARLGDSVLEVLRVASGGEVDLRRSEFVGPAVGEELREQGGMAMLLALGLVMIYIMFRFTSKFSIGAVVALVHDVIITFGFFAVFQWTFDQSVLAAVLAVIGYSLNDTIVVSDRIRENFRLIRRGQPVDVVNTSLNQTLGRTLVTSLTTLLVLVALLVFGGEMIRGFAIALIIGVVVGTYSSIYVAASLLLTMGISREDLLVPAKEGTEDNVP
ncbi:MAG: protein translocase subunit SecF [Gammaproteobacteria bacterium]|nr:protein translocase subunit SecF [Gammaproteobacteria bacterium]